MREAHIISTRHSTQRIRRINHNLGGIYIIMNAFTFQTCWPSLVPNIAASHADIINIILTHHDVRNVVGAGCFGRYKTVVLCCCIVLLYARDVRGNVNR